MWISVKPSVPSKLLTGPVTISEQDLSHCGSTVTHAIMSFSTGHIQKSALLPLLLTSELGKKEVFVFPTC